MESTTMWRLRPSTSLASSRRRSSPPEVVYPDWPSTLAAVRGVVRLLLRPAFAAKGVVDAVELPVRPPLVEASPDRATRREAFGRVSPPAAGAQHVEDGVEDLANVRLARPPAKVRGDEGLDQGPLLI